MNKSFMINFKTPFWCLEINNQLKVIESIEFNKEDDDNKNTLKIKTVGDNNIYENGGVLKINPDMQHCLEFAYNLDVNSLADIELNITELTHTKIELYKRASNDYYNSDESELTDTEFDELSYDLRNLHDNLFACDKLQNELNTMLYGIQSLSGEIVGVLPSDNTSTMMISLEKIKFESKNRITSDVRKFLNQSESYKLAPKQLKYSPKLDGMAIELKKTKDLQNIELIKTRGGLDVTEKLRNHPDIIRAFKKYNDTRIIRGELVIAKNVFKTKYKENFETKVTYANERNFVSSQLKSNNPSQEMLNDFRFLEYSDHQTMIGNLWRPITIQQLINIDTMFFAEFKNNDFPYLTDGVVVGYEYGPNDVREVKHNFPLNMVALKFKSVSAKTTIIGFDWSVKKSGNITPTYKLKPVELDGTTVSSANAYNYGNILSLKAGIGSEVTIIKSGDIIPVIDKVYTHSNKIDLPTIDYRISSNGKHLIALDNEISREHRFILGLKLLELDGIGDVLAEKIGSIVNFNIIELFNTEHKVDIIRALGVGSVNSRKFLKVYDIDQIPLNQLIEILQFQRCGKVLSSKFASIILGQKIDTKSIDKEVLDYVCRGGGFNIIKMAQSKLTTYGVKITRPVEVNDDTLTYVLTGTPPNGMTKDIFMKHFQKQYPNSVNSSLTKNTSLLIVGDMNTTSSKANKARKYNIKIVTYEQALNGNI